MRKAVAILASNAGEAFRSLSRARLRTALALIGIVIGIGSVITMISLGEIARAKARAEFEALGTDILTIRKDDSASRSVKIPLADAVRLADALPEIAEAAPRIRAQGSFVHAGRRAGSGAIQGVTESFARINKLELEDGRFVSDLDVRRYFCVVGAKVARAMRRAGAGRIVGETLVTKDRVFTIVGVLRHVPENYALPFQVDANPSIFIPITTAARLQANAEISLIIARARTDLHYSQAARAVQDWFRERAPKLKLEVVSAKQLIEQMESQMQLMTLLLAAIGSVSLIVGGIGVMNVMLVSVAERRREIGIRRALGARRRDIQNQFLVECIILSIAGGVFGILAGTGATWAICSFTEWDFFVSTTAAISGIAVASAVGILFGFQPAYQAARLDPIVALQAE